MLNLLIIKWSLVTLVCLPALSATYVGFKSLLRNTVISRFRFFKFFPVVVMLIVLFLSYGLFFYCYLKNEYFKFVFDCGSWIRYSSTFDIHWSFVYDNTTAVMFIVVSTVSFLVHLYSLDYMKFDPNLIRFMSYLSLFTFFMLFLVSAGNLVQMFIGWEGVGICSYLLINFWYTRVQANKAALKAVLVNKIGDCAFIFALGLIFNAVGSFDFDTVTSSFFLLSDTVIHFFFFEVNLLGLVCLFLFFAAMAKSALFGLHTWLPDAMEGPTPVSALIHAATMVTAGVYLLIRLGKLFLWAPDYVLNFVTFIGGITCFFGASVALVQYDIKKIIAYSTCSQLGYMVLACGLGNFSIALFHLTTHAFFKALLFLGAGVIIHFLNDEQDLRKMGGLVYYMPGTFLYMLIGSLALIGFPFLSGFYSKELILELSYVNLNGRGFFAYWLGLISAFFTAFYSTRLLYFVFFGTISKSQQKRYERLVANNINGDSNSLYTDFPLTMLGLGSIFVGFYSQNFFLKLNNFYGYSTFEWIEHEVHSIWWIIKDLPIFISFFAIFFCILLNENRFFILWSHQFLFSKFGYELHKFFLNKWYIDSLYNTFIVMPLYRFAYKIAYVSLEKGWLEFFGPTGITKLILRLSFFFKRLQSGFVHYYAFILIFVILIFVGFVEFYYYNLFVFDTMRVIGLLAIALRTELPTVILYLMEFLIEAG